jgi:hypothetical protein
MMILVAFSRHAAALDWARQWGRQQLGEVALESPRFRFVETDYYDEEMGRGLQKTFFAFRRLVPPDALVAAKLQSNAAEQQFAATSGLAEARPLNLDPGYLSESKFLLASTKDHAHRVYLGQGIYAEITLRFRHHAWQPWDWTYPDYRRRDYRDFLAACRDEYRRLRMQLG